MAEGQAIFMLDIHVDVEDVRESVFKILEKVKPQWKKSDVIFKTFTEGRINTLVGCYTASHPDDKVMVRVYADKWDDIIDRKAEAENIKKLSLTGYAPELQAFFKNGFCYKYFPGQSLTIHTVTKPDIWRLVAKAFASLHSIQSEGLPRSNFFNFIRCQLKKFPQSFTDLHILSRFPKDTLDRKNLLKEVDFLQRQVESLDSPVVFCHGDPAPENIICNKDKGEVMFIDFEFSSFDYQAIDLAFHFCEFAGLEDPDYSRFPSEAFQKEWLRVYLQELLDKAKVKATDNAIEERVAKLYKQVRCCVPPVHFVAAIVSLSMGLTTMEKSVIEYAAIRFEQYFQTKFYCSEKI